MHSYLFLICLFLDDYCSFFSLLFVTSIVLILSSSSLIQCFIISNALSLFFWSSLDKIKNLLIIKLSEGFTLIATAFHLYFQKSNFLNSMGTLNSIWRFAKHIIAAFLWLGMAVSTSPRIQSKLLFNAANNSLYSLISPN